MLNVKKVVLACTLSVYLLLFLTECVSASKSKGLKEKCTTCKDIVTHFKEGLEKTKKSNFGGGNTRWEEKSLGTWAHSETRLVEIMDNHLCPGNSKDCHAMLEMHEEDVEEYWFKVHAKDENVDMLQWFCIARIKVCCPKNTYGPKCTPCTGGKERPCKNNGVCKGEGTREGTGKCKCNDGYQGDLCDECLDNYYEEAKNDTHTTCTKCHESCKSTCWEPGPKGCDECKSGWTMSENDECVDIDECPDSPCDESQYCTNTPGKFTCATCHRACRGCTGYGADKCEECMTGYKSVDSFCKDINECEDDTSLCTGDKQSCENTDGSYKCTCSDGLIFNKHDKTCIEKPKAPVKSRTSKEKTKRKASEDQDKPSLILLLSMILVFYVCCSIIQWNLIIVFCLSVVFAVFIYWFGAQHDVI